MRPDTCIGCNGTGYIGPGHPSWELSVPDPCPDCYGRGVEPAPDPLNWNPAADPVVRAILAMGEGER